MQIENEENNYKTPLDRNSLSLDMYNIPPIQDFKLSKLSKISQKRIDLYKKMERFLDRHREDESEQKEFYKSLSREVSKNEFNSLEDDLYSHWICHLVFHNTDLGQYIMFENFIFCSRLYSHTRKIAEQKLNDINQSNEKKEPYIKRFQRQLYFDFLLNYLGVDPQDKSLFKGVKKNYFVEGEKLDPSFNSINDELLTQDTRRIEIPFKFCSKLIMQYNVELNNGKALIYPSSAFMVISEIFQTSILQNDQRLKPVYNSIKLEDERISSLVDCLKDYYKNYINIYFEEQNQVQKLAIKPESINTLSKHHFPLCMKEILKGFRKKHMLKHWGRLQLGMFLKGIGMKMSDNVQLFESELKKTPQGEKKISEYKYYIEHMYGKRGKKTDYTPWSCSKIANKAIPGKDEYFGCPYKYYSNEKLQIVLESALNKAEIQDVLQVPKDNYTLRCKKVYQYTHPDGKVNKGIGRHPNSYYLGSYFYHKRSQQPVHMTNLTVNPQTQD